MHICIYAYMFSIYIYIYIYIYVCLFISIEKVCSPSPVLMNKASTLYFHRILKPRQRSRALPGPRL